MGKIWLKTKQYQGMDIPHNRNFAIAMYGFMELGADIVPYHDIRTIYDAVTKDDIVIDYIDQCRAIFYKFGVKPNLPDYPEELKEFLGRKVWKDTINSIASDENKWSKGYFVKPTRQKAFTGKVITSIGDLVGCGSEFENYEVLVSEPLDILAEWRGFILYDELIDVRPYGLLINGQRKSWIYHYDNFEILSMMDAFRKWESRPVACSMDICLTKDHKTLLLEMNDAYSLGNYGLSDVFYAKMISARWSQLIGRKDEFCV